MTPSLRDGLIALAGAARLMRFDRRGAEAFGADLGAVWASFWAAPLTAPLYVIYLNAIGADRGLAIETIAYVMQWTAFPLAMVTVSDLMGKSTDQLFRFICATNWSGVLAALVATPVAVVALAGPDAAKGSLILFGAWLFLLAYQGFVAMATLQASSVAAAGIVALSVVIGQMIHMLADAAAL